MQNVNNGMTSPNNTYLQQWMGSYPEWGLTTWMPSCSTGLIP